MQRSVLVHEIGHIQRFDCLSQLAGQIFCAVYWYHPMSWLINRKLRCEAEAACDDLAIRSGSEPSEYAGHLLHIAKSFKGNRLLMSSAASMAGTTKLRKRLGLILKEGINRGQLSGACALLCFGAATCFTLAFSTVRIGADPSPPSNPVDSNPAVYEGTDSTNEETQNPVTPSVTPQTPDSSAAIANEKEVKTQSAEDSADESVSEAVTSGTEAGVPIREGGILESVSTIEVRSEMDKPTEIL